MKYLDSEKDFQLESFLKENEALREELEEQKELVKKLEEQVVKCLYEKIELRSELELMREKGGPGKVRSKSPDKTPRQLKGEKKLRLKKIACVVVLKFYHLKQVRNFAKSVVLCLVRKEEIYQKTVYIKR